MSANPVKAMRRAAERSAGAQYVKGCSARKAAFAACLIMAAIAVSVGIDRAGDATGQAEVDETVTAAQMIEAVNDGGGSSVGSAVDGTPDGFEDEFFPIAEYREVRHSADGRVVGLTATGEPSAVFKRCQEQMEARGWTGIDSGQSGRATFLKGQGRYGWACLDCTETGEDTAVVIIVERRE